MKKTRWVLSLIISIVLATSAVPQSKRSGGGPSVNPGGITPPSGFTIQGRGSSSGDALTVKVARKGRGNPRDVVLNIPPGTRLRSSSGSAQSMVAAGVRGRLVSGNMIAPESQIRSSGSGPTNYILEAYCAEFYKNNPSPSVTFKIGGQDRVLACIFREASGLSVRAKQAAVWIYTDHITYRQMRAKFPVSQSEWAEAERVVKRCPGAAGLIKSKKPPAPRVIKNRRPARPAKSRRPTTSRATRQSQPARRHR
jgi:hypothetical protein